MAEKIKAVIIDDEKGARSSLSKILEDYHPDIEVMASCENVPEGVLAINRFTPQVIFLDIEMPEYSGFELLEFFRQVDFEIIFITAYNKYALKAFEVSAIDYILKPIRMDHLDRALMKLRTRQQANSMQHRLDTLKSNLQNDEIQKIAVPVADGLEFIKLMDISHLNADGSYTVVHLLNGKEKVVSKKLKFFAELLFGSENFYRVHRSHIVHLRYIQKYNRHESLIIMENSQIIKVARDNKVAFEASLQAFHGKV